jgi:predicted HTH domain antitoxin
MRHFGDRGFAGGTAISSGRAAELLGMQRMDFTHYASRLGISDTDMTKDEWEAEKAVLEAWPRS